MTAAAIPPRRAADTLVRCLELHGVDRMFCVPGESYLALLDALRDSASIQTVACRHEGGAGFMAVADAKLTGRPGVVAVSRGPGATNVSIALHLAEQDAVPLVALIGQVARHERGRGAFQEVDYAQMFGGVAKGVWEVGEADRLPEILARAFHRAQSGTPGPVAVVLPEDLLSDPTSAPPLPPYALAAAGPDSEMISKIRTRLSAAQRPVLIAGGGLNAPEGRQALARAARALSLPVVLSFKRQELFDNASPLFAGYLGFKIPKPQIEALSEADLVLAVGTRLGDVTTQNYQFPSAPTPAQPLIHVSPGPDAIGGVFQTEIGLACDPAAFLDRLADGAALTSSSVREEWIERLNQRAKAMAAYQPRRFEDGLDFGVVVQALADQADKDAILSLDSGNFSSWVHRIWPWDGRQTCIGAVGGAMGLGVPGAAAACLRHPERQVLCFVGDGGVMMTGNELATAAAMGAAPKIFVANNGSYGTIRLHQERDHPRRSVATDLVNPDFAAWGRAFGALGLTVAEEGRAGEAVSAALAHDGPVVVDVKCSLEAISAYTTITKLRGG
ncbi:MAG: acetolactate synthase [Rhodobacteraceae bacterium]|nr:acetolactate synthase [Paracoccaceae bacterium]